MNKLPVFQTVGNAMGFTLYNSFTIFRLAWLPFAAFMAAELALGVVLAQSLGVTIGEVPNPLTISMIFEKVLIVNIALGLLQALVVAAVAVSIHRVILFGDRRPGQYFNFAFGRTELLYVFMGILSALMFLTVVGVFFGPIVYFASGGDPVGLFDKLVKDPETLAAMIKANLSVFLSLYFVLWVALVYLSVRLAVWPPAVVATNRLSFGEAWQLTRVNVWRIIGAFVLTFFMLCALIALPLAVAAYQYYTVQMKAVPSSPAVPAVAAPAPVEPAAPAVPTAPPAATVQPQVPAAPAVLETKPAVPAPQVLTAEDEKRNRERVREMVEQMSAPYAPLLWVIELIVYIYATALVVALVSYSYKALKGYDAREPIPSEGE
jgi:hypothetical protein